MIAAGGRPRVIVVQHVVHEPLGTLEPALASAGDLHVLAAYGDPVAYGHAVDDLVHGGGYDAVVALGGPCAVYDHGSVECLDHSLTLLHDALRRDLPVLGVCLGAQLLAWSLGAQVWPGRTRGLRKEIGWFPVSLSERGRVDPAFHGFDDTHAVFQWHGDTFELPEGAWRLAEGTPYRNQAFRWGRWAYGLQFHVEVTPDLVARWVEVYADELVEAGGVDGSALVARAREEAAVLERRAEVLGRHFGECVRAAWAEHRGATPRPPVGEPIPPDL